MASAITMTGADGVHRQRMVVASRLVSFPDGLHRVIRLNNWQWQVFDRWQVENGWHPGRIPEGAVRIAKTIAVEYEGRDYEQDVRDAFVSIVCSCMADCSVAPLEAVNENLSE